MATFTMVVRSTVPKDFQPKITAQEDNSCRTSKTVQVPVPVGESRRVVIAYTGTGNPSGGVDEDITTTTNYQVLIDRTRDDIQANNTEFSTGYIRVSLTSSDPTFFSTGITRYHKTNIC